MKCWPVIILLIFSFVRSGATMPDSIELLSIKEYLQIVSKHHPMVYQSDLLREQASANLMLAKGSLDPKIQGSLDRKSFDEKNYYTIIESGLKIPTWFGAEIRAGYSNSTGQNLNNSDLLPLRGIWELGISLPLLKGLVIDERRAEIKQAKLFVKANEQERIMLLNTLYFDAMQAYLDWQVAYANLSIAQEGLAIAQNRFEGIKQSYLNGDKPAIDTLESFITTQNRMQSLVLAEQELRNSQFNIQNFLWLDGYVPLELERNTIPEEIEITWCRSEVDYLSLIKENLIVEHPEVLLYSFKLSELEIERRMTKDALKPDLRVSYNPLFGSTEDRLFASPDINDYKAGASLKYPLFLRKERAKIRLTELKIESTNIEQVTKRQSLLMKLEQYANDARRLEERLNVLYGVIENYGKLLGAENVKLQIGESSIFLINSREQKYLESRQKLILEQKKLLKNRFLFLLFSGELANTFVN